jgi:hypothetical protein
LYECINRQWVSRQYPWKVKLRLDGFYEIKKFY